MNKFISWWNQVFYLWIQILQKGHFQLDNSEAKVYTFINVFCFICLSWFCLVSEYSKGIKHSFPSATTFHWQAVVMRKVGVCGLHRLSITKVIKRWLIISTSLYKYFRRMDVWKGNIIKEWLFCHDWYCPLFLSVRWLLVGYVLILLVHVQSTKERFDTWGLN